VAAAVLGPSLGVAASPAAAMPGPPGVASATPGGQLYVAGFRPGVDPHAAAISAAEAVGADASAVVEVYDTALSGAAFLLTAAQGSALGRLPDVDYAGLAPPLVPAAQAQPPAPAPSPAPAATPLAASAGPNVQSAAGWHLDVLDGTADGRFIYPTNPGAGVPIYIVDTPVMTSHTEFAGRASHGGSGQWACAYDEWEGLEHGTAVASVAAGRTLGVAKAATVISAGGINCLLMGSAADLLRAMDLIAAVHEAGTPGVVNMSLGFFCGYPSLGAACTLVQQGLDTLRDEGLVVVAAAGNKASLASCRFYPAGSPDVVSVGALAPSGAMAAFSNFGECVDVFAPGEQVAAATNTGVTHTAEVSGTSFASPLVAGLAAVMLGVDPSLSPVQVKNLLVRQAALGVITGLPADTFNRSLRVDAGLWPRGPQQGVAPHATGSPNSCGLSDQASVPGWAGRAGCWAKATRVVSGAALNPQSVVSRAEAVTFLWRAAGSPAAPTGCGFRDAGSIPAWARAASCWAKQRGVTVGESFNPAQPATRSQAVLMLARAGYRPADVWFSGPLGRYADYLQMSPEVEQAADWAHAQRITTANPFRPGAAIPRAEFLTMLWRAAGAR
jgi:subtilisin family serine protease